VAIKDDGAHPYSFVNGAFDELVHDTAGWSTGDTLRLEVWTITTNTARLTVFRNGTALFAHDDASHIITGGGQPGIGLHASTAIALDDWRGGEVNETGSNWSPDQRFGENAAVTANQGGVSADRRRRILLERNTCGADQYSEIRITGGIGDWTGVSVRGNVAPCTGLLAGRQERRDLSVLFGEPGVPPCWPRTQPSGPPATCCDSKCGPSRRIPLA
jgi:hypothetical protein